MIKVKKAEPRKHKRWVLGGEPDIGKSTAATKICDNGLWLDLDGRIPDEVTGKCSVYPLVMTFNSLKVALKDILEDKDAFPYNGLVIDTMTILESMARDHSIEQDYNGNTNNYADYSKGDKNNLPIYINSILSLLDRIGDKRGIDVVIICHSDIKPEKNPNGENYDKVSLCLTKNVRARLMQWADYVGFAWKDVKVETVGMSKVAKTGTRMISFCNSPKWDAKGSSVAQVEFDIDGKWMEGLKATPVVEVAKKSGLVTKEHK
jgi:hypothetical protein